MTHTIVRPADVIHYVIEHPRRVFLPVAIATLLAVVYSFVRPTTWEVSQALVVRDEAGDRLTRPGRFAHADEMKTSQETILELAKSSSVLTKALIEVGPPADYAASAPWPSEAYLESLQNSIRVTPPKGAEFGKTEVFYLKVQDGSRKRAVELATAICGALQQRFGELRADKARGTTEELTHSVKLAQEDLKSATDAVTQIEQSVGSDLAELRILNESPAGDSDLRRIATELEKELRGYRASYSEGQEFLKLLNEAQDDPNKLLAAPSVLLKSQPALGRLKDGLVDAQLRTGLVQGAMADAHPLVRAARAGEDAIRQQLHDEIAVAIKGVEVDLRVNGERIRDLEAQEATIQKRHAQLASVRANYANLVTAAKSRAESLRLVEHDLAEARASQAAAMSASLISPIDRPEGSSRPVGPGKTMIVAAGMAGGLAISLAIVFLSITPAVGQTPAQRSVSLPASKIDRPLEGLNLKQALRRFAGMHA